MNKQTLYSLLSFMILLLIFAPQVMVLAAPAAGGGGDSIKGIVGKVKDSLTGLGAALATIAFVVAGIMFLTATGNPSRMTIAKGSLVAGVIGIVIILLANNACTFVKTFTGASGACE